MKAHKARKSVLSSYQRKHLVSNPKARSQRFTTIKRESLNEPLIVDASQQNCIHCIILGDDKKIMSSPSIDTSSPYYLGSSDQPKNMIIHVILTVQTITSRGLGPTDGRHTKPSDEKKFVFIDGTQTKPTVEKKMLDGVIVNLMLVSWIIRSIDSKLPGSFMYHEEAKKLWEYFKKRYSGVNGSYLQYLWVAIADCKQVNYQYVEDYYTKLMIKYDELARLKTLHGCECGKSYCDVDIKYARDGGKEIFHQFLIGVDDDKYGVCAPAYCRNILSLIWSVLTKHSYRRKVCMLW